MKLKLSMVALALLLLSGCSIPSMTKEEAVEIETEVPTPDTITDTTLQLTYDEITVSYTLTGTQAFGLPNEDYLTVYESVTSFNCCNIEVKYMPNYKRLESSLSEDTYINPISEGYVVIVTDNGLGANVCKDIAESVTVVGE